MRPLLRAAPWMAAALLLSGCWKEACSSDACPAVDTDNPACVGATVVTDECQTHRTVCTEVHGLPVCLCDSGYQEDQTGACKQYVARTDACVPNPCTAPGAHVCVATMTGFICQCDAGYQDDGQGNCVQPVEPGCEQVECTEPNKGKCTLVDGTPTCVCDDGYEDDGQGNCVEKQTPDELCQGKVCQYGAHCEGGNCVCSEGYFPDGENCKPNTPCAETGCGEKGWCDLMNVCHCKPGFAWDGSACSGPTAWTAPDQRPQEEVCARFKADWGQPPSTPQTIDADPAQCKEGSVPADALNDGLRRLNLYRYLAGEDPAWDLPTNNLMEQKCALVEHEIGTVDYYPDVSAHCYSVEAKTGVDGASIVQGCQDLICAVDALVVSGADISHRCRALCPTLAKTGFGLLDGFACTYTMDKSGQAHGDYVTYPGAGFFPRPAVPARWMFMSDRYVWTATTKANALVGGATTIALTVKNLASSTCMPAMALEPANLAEKLPGPDSAAGEVTITVEGLMDKTSGITPDAVVSYTVKVVDCN